MSKDDRYQIAAVSRLTGVPADTIRAWERRYALVEPARNAAGVRMYSEDDVDRLSHARSAVDLGHPIRLVAGMSNDEIRGLVAREAAASPPANAAHAVAARTMADVLKAVEEYDVARAEQLLNAAALLLPPMELVGEVLGPLMRTIGDRWESGRFSIAQEHLTSQLVRNLLANITRTSVITKKHTMLFAAPSGEAHEFGLLFAAFLAGLAGVKHHVLGCDVPVSEVVRVARRTLPDIVVIAMLREPQDVQAGAYVKNLAARLPAKCAMWLGGPYVRDMLSVSASRIQAVPTLEMFARRAAALK